MATKSTPPSITETAFDYPYCGAFTTQHWLRVHAAYLDGEQRTPNIPNEELKQNVREAPFDEERKKGLVEWIEKMESGLIFLEHVKQGRYINKDVHNVFLSECYNCRKYAVWVRDNLVYPAAIAAPPANIDLPQEVLQDYEEAGRIEHKSPRGAAALLRLAIQKLCAFLGEKGRNIDEDIASLVQKGLSPMVQKALDAVRVIGNEAVHPGTLDLKDDRTTTVKLFKLVNIIAEQMISNPKHVEELYGQLPESKRQAIDKRDGKIS